MDSFIHLPERSLSLTSGFALVTSAKFPEVIKEDKVQKVWYLCFNMITSFSQLLLETGSSLQEPHANSEIPGEL